MNHWACRVLSRPQKWEFRGTAETSCWKSHLRKASLWRQNRHTGILTRPTLCADEGWEPKTHKSLQQQPHCSTFLSGPTAIFPGETNFFLLLSWLLFSESGQHSSHMREPEPSSGYYLYDKHVSVVSQRYTNTLGGEGDGSWADAISWVWLPGEMASWENLPKP